MDLRGGHVYPDLIEQSERKPIRIYLQDGVNDYRGKGRDPKPETPYNAKRDWHAQNLKMLEALQGKGYEVNYTWGIGTHSGRHGGAILPEIMRDSDFFGPRLREGLNAKGIKEGTMEHFRFVNAGHWVAEQAPDELLAALTTFLAPHRESAR